MDITVIDIDSNNIYNRGFRYKTSAMSCNILFNRITGSLRGYPGDTLYTIIDNPPPGW